LVAGKVADLIESKRHQAVRCRITKFFKESKNKMETVNILKQVMVITCKAYIKSKVGPICTGDANLTGRGLIPIPQVCVANDTIGSALGSANCQTLMLLVQTFQ